MANLSFKQIYNYNVSDYVNFTRDQKLLAKSEEYVFNFVYFILKMEMTALLFSLGFYKWTATFYTYRMM